jgi:hypothetical protein
MGVKGYDTEIFLPDISANNVFKISGFPASTRAVIGDLGLNFIIFEIY